MSGERTKGPAPMLRRIALAVTLALLVTLPATAQDYQKGLAAAQRDDHATALNEFLPLAEQGHAGAQYYLGVMYLLGKGVPQDDVEAAKWSRKAAEQGDSRAQSNLGAMHQRGRGAPQDNTEAVKWYRKAAQQGHTTAQFNLGVMYVRGLGVPQDYAEALTWYHKAAEKWHAKAQHHLGIMYAKGLGAKPNYRIAHMWFSFSAANGHKNGSIAQNQVAKRMTPAQIAEAKKLAREWRAKHPKKR
jgi:TPR repeat protein